MNDELRIQLQIALKKYLTKHGNGWLYQEDADRCFNLAELCMKTELIDNPYNAIKLVFAAYPELIIHKPQKFTIDLSSGVAIVSIESNDTVDTQYHPAKNQDYLNSLLNTIIQDALSGDNITDRETANDKE